MMTLSTPEENEPQWVQQVLHFWFCELNASDRFSGDAAIDARIRDRFMLLHEKLASSEGGEASQVRPLLAAVIVLDQFSRNMFRGTPRAFATDATARNLAGRAITNHPDSNLNREERYFLYLPFEHSEDRADQALAVRLISQLGSTEWTNYALAHQQLIDRFGRFPHRNTILGRESSAEEIAAMNEPMGSF